ncbi:hypothetical protein FRC11_000544 [Ceratobasidium sp. 423]|nr:hypothetical protein FRC11_000544 [Ceratobasidium sp. 423]
MTLRPGYAYLRDWKAFQTIGTERLAFGNQDICTYIDDYREGTVLDALGSIGGLFALLQAAHVLLFGKPMLWGLTGAKLITPFGLIGMCTSKGFKRRLRQHYYGQDTQGSETFKVGAFLRDYVLELGPADFDPGQPARVSSGNASSPSRFISQSGEAIDEHVQVPLMPMGVQQTSSCENGFDINAISRGTSERGESTAV